MRGVAWIPSLLAAVALLGSLWALCPPAPGLGAALPCTQAQLIEGQLRCDDDLLSDLEDQCPAAPSRALGPGDAVGLGACVCAAYPGLRQLGLGCAASLVARMPSEQLAALEQVVNINLASPSELASLAGIGPKLAERIVAGRPYNQVDDLLAVKGIGAKRLAAIRPRVRVE
ncbi:ComEA family DNA-binding protein [Enhygromyxa salina]|uniref:ComE operon protein 1 n=1 Tax=Enhygromyxa salina TaxID=215803 RepID=A0A2S9Y1R9_9BACT|nr:helix-hairpin-helix domain-containing protein [Enhygromyxa salina]PRP99039.1 ComE operon protein 1 [Enhygromyxa salina]